MDPKEFNWGESQQVTVTNPTPNDYKFKVHSKDYELKAGETAKMPGFIAWVYVYGLATQMAQAANQWMHWNEEGFRKQYYDKIVIVADAVIEKVVVEPSIETVDVIDDKKAGNKQPTKT
jgi:hypothetical protein